MDDGGSNADTNRGRSREPRAARSSASTRTESKDPGGEGMEEGETSTATDKKRGRPKGSKNKKRSVSQPRTPTRRSTSKTRKKKDDKTTQENGKSDDQSVMIEKVTQEVVDLSGEQGRAVKQEVMDQTAKIQQTLGFHIKKTNQTKPTPTSAINPCVIHDDEEETTQTSASSSTATPKRKQADMTEGTTKAPSGVSKRMTPNDRHTTLRKADDRSGRASSGRGGGRGGGSRNRRPTSPTADYRVGTPPHTRQTTKVTNEFQPTESENNKSREEETGPSMHAPVTMETRLNQDRDQETPVKKGGTQQGSGRSKEVQAENTLPADRVTTSNEKPRGVRNPYNTSKGTPVTYAAVTKSPQTKIKTHQKLKEAHDSYYEITFYAWELSKDPSTMEAIAVLKAQLKSILARAKEVDRKAKINTWLDTSNLPTIVKAEDIPDTPAGLHAYLSPPRKDRTIQKGRNSNWKVRITTHIPRDEFLHHWTLSKREFTKTPYIPLRSAPLQAPTYHAAGFFLNSSDGQLTETLEKEWTELLGHKVGIAFKPAALHKRAADEYWQKAKQAREQAPEHEKARAYFKNAPMVMQVYAETRTQAKATAYKLNEMYGATTEDGMYPRMPDGTRMRFVAAHIYVDMTGRATAATLFKQQMLFQKYEVTASLPIRDPLQRFATQNNRTMHELVMDLKDPERKNEPYFRNMKKKFHWNYKTREWEVNIHSGMYVSTAQVLRRFKEVMSEQYGEEVGDAILDGVQEDEPQEYGSQSGTTAGISIATDDRYLNGEAKFLILGMENVTNGEKEGVHMPGEIRKGEEDENTIHVKSTTSGMTGHTGNTVPSVRGMEDESHRAIDMWRKDETSDIHKDGIERDSEDKGITQQIEEMDLDKDTAEAESEEGTWTTVSQKKGAKPRPPTLMEKAISFATHLSGSVGGGIT